MFRSALLMFSLSGCLGVLGDYQVSEDDTSLGETCHAEPTFDTCVDCLIDMYPEASTEHALLFVDACLCENECAASCTAECNGQYAFGAGCSSCLDALSGYEVCPTELINRCDASPTCSAYVDLTRDCPR